MPTAYKSHPKPHPTQSFVAAPINDYNINSSSWGYPNRIITASQSTSNNTSPNMSSPQTTHIGRASQPYALVPSHIADPSISEMDLNNMSWMATTVIEDDDLMFGGKPLSAWYEEDQQLLSTVEIEEERRGRQRERARVEPPHKHHHYHNHQHQHQQHAKKTQDIKQ